MTPDRSGVGDQPVTAALGSEGTAQEGPSVVAESITIIDNRTGNQLEIPIRNGGVAASEWSKLLPGVWFFDPGFVSTAACESAVSFVDGDAGIGPLLNLPIDR